MDKQDIVEAIKKSMEIAQNNDLNLSSSNEKLSELLARLQEERFQLAVLGQFKRGKSTLVNALLGLNILPTAVVPLTAIPTFIYYNDNLSVTVCFLDKKKEKVQFEGSIENLNDFLDKYVTETGNPENKLGVSHVEIYYPSKLLQKGFVLIDTPGIGSTFQHNTEMTINFLPQCDAALFVTSTDPPITEVEVNFLKSVKSHVPKIFFILNKIDYLDEDELKTSKQFLSDILTSEVGINDISEIFGVSSKKALNGKVKNKPELYKESNLKELEDAIQSFMEKDKLKALIEAIAQKSSNILENILMQLKILIKSYTTPLEELEKKIKILEKKIEEAYRQKVVVSDILKGDMQRVESLLDSEADKLKDKAYDYFEKKLREYIETLEPKEIKNRVQIFLNENIPPYFEREFGKFSRDFSEKASLILSSHEDKAVEVVESIRQNAMQLMDIPYIPLHGEKGLKMRIKPYWVVNKWDTTLTAISNSLMDIMASKTTLKKRLLKRYLEKLDLLIYSNIENLRWPIYQGVQDTFREFLFDFDNRMKDVITATKGAVEKAIRKKRSETGKVDQEVAKLEKIVEETEDIKKILAGNV